jgi:hypothetical protein
MPVCLPAMPNRKGKVVTFWLRPAAACLVEQCMKNDVFPSLSDFFETVLVVFQEHSQALLVNLRDLRPLEPPFRFALYDATLASRTRSRLLSEAARALAAFRREFARS